jgi:adenylate cyclase
MTTRRLAAILAMDVVGSSRLIEADEAGALTAIRAALANVIVPTAEAQGGRLIKTTGDGALFEFASAVQAVQCSLMLQKTLPADEQSGTQPILFRMGVNLGDVVAEDDGDLYGDGVNVAVRLEALADPGGLCISHKVFEELHGRLPVSTKDLGQQQLKNISRPVRVYAVQAEGTLWGQALPSAPTLPDRPSIVVLPFDNLSGDPAQDYFVDGVVESVTTALARLKWLFVIARNSAFTYKGRSVDVRHVGRELGVRYVLEGSVRKAGDRIRLTGQLIDAGTGRHMWADTFDGTLGDVFELQDKLTGSVIMAAEPSLRAAEIERARAKSTDNLDAYDLYLRALPLLYAQTQQGMIEAQDFLRRAVELDPNYCDALAALADCIGRAVIAGWLSDVEGNDEAAFAFARRAVAADPEHGEALAIAAWAYAVLGGRFDAALEHVERALRLHPNSLLVRNYSGAVFAASGESLRAIEEYQAAQRLSPVDPRAYISLSGIVTAHFFARNFEEAVARAKRILVEWPSHAVSLRYLAASLAHLGRRDEAQQTVSDLLKVQPNSCLSRSRHSRFRHQWMYDLYLEGLREAGLPE